MDPSVTERIYVVVRQIPLGRVASYGQIARMAGNPRWARIVGYAVSRAPESGCLPCHRVVFQDGTLCADSIFGGPGIQRQMLQSEGITFEADGKVRMAVHRW